MVEEINAEEAAKLIEGNKVVKVIDVREADEYEYGHLFGSTNFPMSAFSNRIFDIINKDNKLLVVCRSGSRSLECANRLDILGYRNVSSVKGGLRRLNNFLRNKVGVKEW